MKYGDRNDGAITRWRLWCWDLQNETNGRLTPIRDLLCFKNHKHFLCDYVLHKESIRINFNKYIIVRNRFINRKKMFLDLRNIKNIFKMKWSTITMNFRMTNMVNMQTCSIIYFNLVFSLIVTCNRQAIKITCEMINVTRIIIPVGIIVVALSCDIVSTVVFFFLISMIKLFFSIQFNMTYDSTYFTTWVTIVVSIAIMSSAMVASIIVSLVVVVPIVVIVLARTMWVLLRNIISRWCEFRFDFCRFVHHCCLRFMCNQIWTKF